MSTGSARFPVRFPVGAKAYAKDGRVYTIDEVADGMVYCRGEGGEETEFPEASLVNETEWAAQANGRRDLAYSRIKQARAFTTPAGKFDRAAAERLLTQSDRVIPGLLDFIAFTAATRVLEEQKDHAGAQSLSIVKCRRVFDEATPEVRVTLLASVLDVQPDTLVSAAKLGDNMAKAMIDKGLEARAQAFEDFCDRPRK
jgi:hypothetical protein